MPSTAKPRWSRHFRKTDALAAAQVAVQTTNDIIDVTESLHLSIQQRLSPAEWLNTGTKWVYRGVKLLPGTTQQVLTPLAKYLSGRHPSVLDSDSDERRHVIAALNGLIGDQLVEYHSPLAVPMALVRSGPSAAPHTLVMIHGLCMDERAWDETVVNALTTGTETDVWRVRYNSGLNIRSNGEQLAEMLNQTLTEHSNVTLIGHSMGGLVALYALQYALKQQMPWQNRIKALVTLGTPFTGAPLAHWGHWAEQRLSASTMTRPFTFLTKRRSEGIQNLRHGYSGSLPENLNIPVLCIAGQQPTIGLGSLDDTLGDGLVTQASALAMNHGAQHWVAEGVGHLALLKDSQVFQRVTQFLRNLSDASI